MFESFVEWSWKENLITIQASSYNCYDLDQTFSNLDLRVDLVYIPILSTLVQNTPFAQIEIVYFFTIGSFSQ